jgi:hypothetical protein
VVPSLNGNVLESYRGTSSVYKIQGYVCLLS